MPDDPDPFMMIQTPTAERPLLGLTVLVVEDSRFACEAMRLLCLRSGARIRRADSLKSARRHLSVYRPAVVIIDIGLPDGSGTELIRELSLPGSRVEVILGISGDPDGAELAQMAGADGFLVKPIESLSVFQQIVLSHLPAEAQPRGLRLIADDNISLDTLALHDDLEHMADVLNSPRLDGKTIAYVAQFLTGVARIAHDTPLVNASLALADAQFDPRQLKSALLQVSGMVRERLQDQRQVV
ncbi:MAG: response regulator [Paracoccaceae bacterium]